MAVDLSGAKSFIFGGDTPWSYEQMQQQRAIAEMLRSANTGSPATVGQGLSAVGRALGARRREQRADKREGELRDEYKGEWGGMFKPQPNAIAEALNSQNQWNAGVSASPTQPTMGGTPNAPQVDYNAPQPIVPQANNAEGWNYGGNATGPSNLGAVTAGQNAQDMASNVNAPVGGDIRQGLIARGLPPHIADGFMMNFQDESGMDPNITEAAANVHGTRGKGLYQLTGARRDAFEAKYGNDYSVDNQLDFLMQELGSTESGAMNALQGTKNAGEAASVIVNDFLRPAEEHRASRSQRYMAGSGAMPDNAQVETPDTQQIMALMSNPFATKEQEAYLGALLQQSMPKSEMEQIQLAQARLALQQDQSGVGSSENKVGSQEILEDGTIIQSTQAGPVVWSASGERLSGPAAEAAVQKARTLYTDNQRAIYEARGLGGYDADISAGGEAAASIQAGGIAQDVGLEAFQSIGKARISLGNMNEAIDAIDSGAKSGMIYKMLPSVTEASATLENTMNKMGLDVIGSVTFGALSEGEMKLAMETAVPQNLSPPELRSWLVKKRDAQVKAIDALQAAAAYLSTPGNTLQKWMESQGGGSNKTVIDGYTIEAVD